MFTAMCLKEQQTSENLIAEDYCFFIEIFDKFTALVVSLDVYVI